MRRGLPWMAAIGVASSAGCPTLPPYVCRSESDCDHDGRAGRCLDDDACAYEDVDGLCESGWVRSPHAAIDPGACVPPEEVDTSTTGGITQCGSELDLFIDTAAVSPGTVLEGYPLLISLTAPDLVAAIESTEHEPFIVDADGTALAYDWEELDARSGRLSVWVRLPAYDVGEPLPLRIRFGRAAPANDPVEVWQGNFVGVWHLADTLTGAQDDPIADSVRTNAPGLAGGGMQPDQSVPGAIGRGLWFDGEDDVVSIDAPYVGRLESFAISVWARFEGTDDVPSAYFSRLNGGAFFPRCWRHEEQFGRSPTCQYAIAGQTHVLDTFDAQVKGQLVHLVLTRDAEARRTELWLDGQRVDSSDDLPGTLDAGTNAFEVGRGEWGSFTGMLDELRVREQPLPEAWIQADYRTQLDPASVLQQVGEIRDAPCDE